MTGNDVTEAELRHAREFLEITENLDRLACRAPGELKELIRLFAWYGKLRAHGKPPGIIVRKDGGILK